MTSLPGNVVLPPPRRGPSWAIGGATTSVLATVAASLLMVEMVVAAVVLPRFEAIFSDFGVELPALSRLLIVLARWFRGSLAGQVVPGWMIAVPVAGLVLLAIVGAGWYRSTSRWAFALLVLIIALEVLAIPVGILGAYAPMVRIIEGLQAGGTV